MVLNRQRRIRVSTAQLESFLARAMSELGLPANSLSVCLVSDAEIARWNRSYRRKRGPTDVLSFPAEEKPRRQRRARARDRAALSSRSFASSDFSSSYLGDIAIAPAVARRNAQRFGRKFEHEMRVLILHGILHLMGYDHETDRGQMEQRERRLRQMLGLA